MALSAFDDAARVADEGYQQTENGYGVLEDGSYQVSVRTDMPGVTPAMWSWWFGWHGCDTRRYKLWHPRAHLSAAWKDGDDTGRRGDGRYIGRWSLISEYIGSIDAQRRNPIRRAGGDGLSARQRRRGRDLRAAGRQ